MTIALLDGDILAYRVGFSTQEEHVNLALVRMDNYIEEVLDGSQASEYEIFLTGNTNFRKDIYPAYKANRRNTPKPVHLQALRQHLIDVEGAVVSEGQEADDELGIRQTHETIICSIDKDLLMIPGRHYNFVKQEHSTISNAEGRHNFYRQLLTGDTTDNIPGLWKVGPVKAAAMLDGCTTKEEYNAVVFKAYQQEFDRCSDEEVKKHISIIGRLLWIRREEGEEWKFDC
jgi:DNA polymerase-1